MQDNPVQFEQSILDLLPNPERILNPIRTGMKNPKHYDGPHAEVRFIGGLHNLSMSDKLRWVNDDSKDLLLIESKSDRAELYPQMSFGSDNYRIMMISLLNVKKGLYLHSHHKYHDSHSPQPAILYTTGMARSGVINNQVAVFTKEGNMDSRDFWNRDNNTHNYNVAATRYVRTFPSDHDYLRSIIFTGLFERWKDNEHVFTGFKDMEVIMKEDRDRNKPDDAPSPWGWIHKNCKHGFFPLRDEPFEDESDEFHFLTDMAW